MVTVTNGIKAVAYFLFGVIGLKAFTPIYNTIQTLVNGSTKLTILFTLIYFLGVLVLILYMPIIILIKDPTPTEEN